MQSIRLRHGFTQEDLGILIAHSTKSIGRWESEGLAFPPAWVWPLLRFIDEDGERAWEILFRLRELRCE